MGLVTTIPRYLIISLLVPIRIVMKTTGVITTEPVLGGFLLIVISPLTLHPIVLPIVI